MLRLHSKKCQVFQEINLSMMSLVTNISSSPNTLKQTLSSCETLSILQDATPALYVPLATTTLLISHPKHMHAMTLPYHV